MFRKWFDARRSSGVKSRIRESTLAPGAADGAHSERISALLAEVESDFARGQYDTAMERLRETLAIDPQHVFAHNRLGAALVNLGRYPEAEQEFRRAIELDPSFAKPHFNLGIVLFWRGDFEGAEAAYLRAVELDPGNAETLVSLGMTLGTVGRLEDARSCFERALRLDPRNATTFCSLGWLESVQGRFEEAEAMFRRALEIEPRRSHAWAPIADLRRMTTADRDWLEGVMRLTEGGVPPLEEASLQFALGKYFDDVGEFDEAFRHYQRGNELHRQLAQPYDRPARTAFVDDMVRVYAQQRFAHPADGASYSRRPVFVVGMMRSGTSLVEQIIASHPRVTGAGELDFWLDATRKHEHRLRRDVPDAALAREFADSYLQTLARRSAEALRVVDKSNFNSDCLGLIHLVFPKARVVFVRRDPVDTCLSCYFAQFTNTLNFTTDLTDLAHYYREHHRLMRHWRSALPVGTLLEVPYEDLVSDQETWSRRIIEFIGLDWDARCLDFHKTERPVLTASNWQVRQRVYSSSVGRWKNYEKFIGPLLELRRLM
jgi:tetratricopeptide (TPR) repeat protein